MIPGRLPKLDKLIQQVMVEQGIDDRVLKRHQGPWKDSVVEGLAATKKKTLVSIPFCRVSYIKGKHGLDDLDASAS